MRVLTIVGDLGFGGTQRAAQNYTLGYQQSSCDVALLAINSGGPREEEISRFGIPIFIGGQNSETRQKALDLAKEWKPDIIHIHRRGLAEKETGSILRFLKTSENRVLETNVFSRVDYSDDRHLIDVHLQLSRWCLWKWSQWSSNLTPKSIGAIVPYMIDSSEFYPVSREEKILFRSQVGIPENAFVFGRIGQKSLPKWSPIIFSAFVEVAKKNTHAYLLLVGLPDELKIHLNSISSYIRQRIIVIDSIQGDKNLRACYSSMDVFLHSSAIGESFGMVLVEAMLCECPVITLSTPDKDNSQLEVVGHERGGLVVTDKASMIKAMNLLLEDSSLQRNLSQAGGNFVRRTFELSTAMPALVKIAEIALSTTNKEELRFELLKTKECISTVQTLEISQLLSKTLGNTSIKKKLIMNLVHNPWLYQFYSRKLS